MSQRTHLDKEVISAPRLFTNHNITKLNTSHLNKGEVGLIGAGPGDPELLTIKAFNLLQQAEVVLYDYLVSEEIMSLVPVDAERVCVGKKAGFHSVPQEMTNELLVRYAKNNKRVVRIKGGDPFVFGRGGEELQALVQHGISFQVVPGITAAAGATAYAGIPLTHRDYSQSAMFVTGHLKPDSSELDWSTLARGNQTLVIYMGLVKSESIADKLIEYGRSPSVPIAIIERGTQKNQKVLRGELHELAQLAKFAKSPALIVVGEVVALADELSWFNQPSNERVLAKLA